MIASQSGVGASAIRKMSKIKEPMNRFRNGLAGLLVSALTLFGQLQTGEIRIDVKDQAGSAMEASGSIESLSAGVRRDYQTDAQGTHTFGALPFGRYRLQVGRPGFAPQELMIEVRSALPITHSFTLLVAASDTTVEVREEGTLLDTQGTGAAQHVGPDALETRKSSAPGRSLVDLVDQQPGWLLEANGILHPRGSEYAVQYVIDGIPLYDNRSPAFAQGLGADEFESMTVRTANYPAEFGRKLGGVIEINTQHDLRSGLHGQASLQGGSFSQVSGFGTVQYARDRNSFSLSSEGMATDRYLDPPVLENYTNYGSGGGGSARFDRNWSSTDSTRFYAHSRRTGFLVPNELLQQSAGQRQDRTAAETMGQVSHTHQFSPHVLLQVRGMVRDTSARLWGNALSTPILPDQNRGFREGYAGGSVSVSHGSHDLKFGADGLFTSIHENFGYRIITRQINGVRIFDSDLPRSFRFQQTGTGRDQALFAQDTWHRGGLTVSAGLRFDHYRLVADESAWSPRLGIAYNVPGVGLVLRASYDRIFQEPAVENILLASANLVDQLGGSGVFIPLRPSRGNFTEAGFSKGLSRRLRFDGTWYYRQVNNFSDDSVLLNTGVSFPIAFREARIHGYEAKIEVPRWGMFSGFVSYSNMAGTGILPVAGGLFLGDDAAAAVSGQGSFPITQDQRNTFRSRVRFEPHPRVWFAFAGSYNSGLPFQIEGPSNMSFIQQQYGPEILAKVDFERGRVRPSASLDASVGVNLFEADRKTVRVQADVLNLTDRLNLINFSGVLSGTAIEPRRNFAIRLNVGF
ncbi:MAG: TonB-dependent receptor [Bryobacterales bacterium]|nr:TonB-dependent receptor [Bryobacterales bacterium]